MNKAVRLTLYTAETAIEFDVLKTSPDFEAQLAEGFMEDMTAVTLLDGSTLLINPINVVCAHISKDLGPPIDENGTP